MKSGMDNKRKWGYITGVFGLGLIFSAAWAVMMALIPPNNISSFLNYVMYFMSVTVIAFPTFGLLLLFIKKRAYAYVLTAFIWAFWVFVAKELFIRLFTLMAGR